MGLTISWILSKLYGKKQMRILMVLRLNSPRNSSSVLQGLIFVVDSNDRERMKESAEVRSNLDELRDAVLLVFANKQDLPNAMGVIELTDKLSLDSLQSGTWYIQAMSANQGTGLYERLSNELSKH